MNIDKWDVFVECDLYDAGKTEDYEDYLAECYYIVIERSDGKRYAHFTTFYGVERKEMYEDGYIAFCDCRKDALKQAKKLQYNIKKKKEINLDHWNEMAPSYGSEYYCKINGF